MDVLASYMQWYTENPDAFPNKYNIKITRIGVIKSIGYRYSLNSKQYNPKVTGYDHFKGK